MQNKSKTKALVAERLGECIGSKLWWWKAWRNVLCVCACLPSVCLCMGLCLPPCACFSKNGRAKSSGGGKPGGMHRVKSSGGGKPGGMYCVMPNQSKPTQKQCQTKANLCKTKAIPMQVQSNTKAKPMKKQGPHGTPRMVGGGACAGSDPDPPNQIRRRP